MFLVEGDRGLNYITLTSHKLTSSLVFLQVYKIMTSEISNDQATQAGTSTNIILQVDFYYLQKSPS